MDYKNNINEELDDNLENLAPNLSKLKKEQGFTVPGDYFNELVSHIQQKCADADELEKVAPVLAQMSKYNPFAVPEGYFDKLPAKIQEKSVAGNRRSVWVEWLAWLLRPQFAIAAAVIVLAVIAGVLIRSMNSEVNRNPGQEMTQNEVKKDTSLTQYKKDTSAQKVEAAELEALYATDESVLIESLSGEDLAQFAEAEQVHSHINDEEIINYLIEHNVDISTIANEL